MGTLGETMAQNERNEEAAKRMYLDGITDPHEIASNLGCPVQHVHNWIEWGNWDGNSSKKTSSNEGRFMSAVKTVGIIIFWVVLIAILIQQCS